MLQNCGVIWNVLQMVATSTTKKGNYKTCTSQHAFKDTLHCAHIPLNVVPKGTQPLAPMEWAEAETVWRKRHRGGDRRQRKEKAAFQLKISPQFKGQLQAGWPQAETGVRGRSSGRAGLGRSTSHSGQAESGPASFVYRGVPLWCISAYLPNHQWSFPAWLPTSRQTLLGSLPP